MGRRAIAVLAALLPSVAGAATLEIGTYVGGTLSERLVGIGLDSAANVYVVGTTRSPDFPLVPPASPPVTRVAFVARMLRKSEAALAQARSAGPSSPGDAAKEPLSHRQSG